MDCVIEKVIFKFVSNLARGTDSPWRPGLEIEAVGRFKQSAKQFEGKAKSEKPEVMVAGCHFLPLPSHKLRIHKFSSHICYGIYRDLEEVSAHVATSHDMARPGRHKTANSFLAL